jgi:hypothetical protein
LAQESWVDLSFFFVLFNRSDYYLGR